MLLDFPGHRPRPTFVLVTCIQRSPKSLGAHSFVSPLFWQKNFACKFPSDYLWSAKAVPRFPTIMPSPQRRPRRQRKSAHKLASTHPAFTFQLYLEQ
jgi:hypothetical protein